MINKEIKNKLMDIASLLNTKDLVDVFNFLYWLNPFPTKEYVDELVDWMNNPNNADALNDIVKKLEDNYVIPEVSFSFPYFVGTKEGMTNVSVKIPPNTLVSNGTVTMIGYDKSNTEDRVGTIIAHTNKITSASNKV